MSTNSHDGVIAHVANGMIAPFDAVVATHIVTSVATRWFFLARMVAPLGMVTPQPT